MMQGIWPERVVREEALQCGEMPAGHMTLGATATQTVVATALPRKMT